MPDRSGMPYGRESKDVQKNRRGGEVLDYLKKLEVTNWEYLVKGRNAGYELVQKGKTTSGYTVNSRRRRRIKSVFYF
jgi:hypothetical protein